MVNYQAEGKRKKEGVRRRPHLLAPHHYWTRSKARMALEQRNVYHVLEDPPSLEALSSKERIACLEQALTGLNGNMEHFLALLEA
ncbi:hypothetical protein CDL15_Pgr016295 [Punica granatum]|uniref:Uncharacterized protein n=1 Tax=Punica granatum TaxID=22663 RepID=A0A218W5Q0_PUNGR|nr:hypothetical protein CDL15_Pgr016295 [Punica granatum]